MAGLRVHIVMDAELVERIDAALDVGVSRGEFVRRAVERALGDVRDRPPAGGSPPGVEGSRLESDDSPRRGVPAPAEQPRRLGSHAPTCKCPVCS